MTARNPNTLFVGNTVVSLEEVDSTNSFALRMTRNAAVTEGTVVTAQLQTAGRGQRGASWVGARGMNIACSIILKPAFLPVEQQFELNRVVALAISDLLLELFPVLQVKVKWPNDIFINDKKVAGILIENSISGSQLSFSVVGIGLNLNQEEFPAEVPDAVSIRQLTGVEMRTDEALSHMYGAIEARYLQLRGGNKTGLHEVYEERLYRRNELSRFTDFKTVFEAKITGVSEEGRLLVEMQDGATRDFGFKEIAFLK